MDYATIKNKINIVDLGTEGTRVALGTSAQRGSTQGQLRFNSTNNNLEYYNGSAFQSIDKAPSVVSIDTTLIDKSAGTSSTTDIVITGGNFTSGATVKAIGTDSSEISAGVVVVNSETQITATFTDSSFDNAYEPYDIKVTLSDGLNSTLENVLYVDTASAFSTSSGSLATLNFGNSYASSNITAVVASDPEGEAITMAVISGSIPSGITFNSDGTWSGTGSAPSSNTTYSFTVRATSNGLTTDRAFTIETVAPTHQRFLGMGSGSGGVVSGSSHSSSLGQHIGSRIYNGSVNTPNEWHSGGGDTQGWVSISFSSNQTVSRISLYNRNDCCQLMTSGYLQGWNGSSWVNIASFSLSGSSNSSTTVDTTDSTTAWAQVRLKSQGSNGGYVSMGEIELFKFV